MPKGYLVTAETIEKLRADHEELKTQLKRLQNTVLRRPAAAVGGQAETLALAKTTGTIAGYTTNANGNPVLEGGEATIQTLETDGELVGQARTVTAYNVDSSDVTADSYVNVSRHFKTGKWMIDTAGSGTTLHRVKLQETMGAATANQATADLYSLAGVDTGDNITVLDPDGLYPGALGPRTHPVTSNVLAGAAGYVVKSGSNYYAVELEQAARWIKFSVDNVSGYTTTDASWAIAVVNYWNGQEPAVSLAYNLEVQQTAEAGTEHLFEGSNGAIGLAVYDDTQNLYRIVQMEFQCP